MLLMLLLPVTTLVLAYPSSTGASERYALSASGAGYPASEPGRAPIDDLSGALWQQPAYSSSPEPEASPSISGSLVQWAGRRFDSALPWLVAVWFAGVFSLSIRFLGGLALVERLKRAQTSPALLFWQEKLSSLCEQLRVSRPVRLSESALVEVPTVIGWLRPVILVPASVFTGLSAPQLEALLAHELAHIRRYDYLVNLIQTAVETLLFYHPAVWWVSSQVRQEREHCCDDLAVAVCRDVLVYARALAALEQLRAHIPQAAVAATGGSLLKRIQRLVGSPAPLSHRLDSWLAGLIAIVTAFSILAGSQTALLSNGATPAEVASETSPLSERTRKATGDSSSPGAARRHSTDKPDPEARGEAGAEALGELAAHDSASTQDEAAPQTIEASDQARDSGDQDFISEIAAEGYTNLKVEELIALRTHGITTEFIRGMNASFGSKVPVEHLIALKFHGADPQFVKEMKAAGVSNLSAERVVAFKVHGVTPQFAREMKDLGYGELSPDTLIAFKVHDVSPAFFQEVKSLGFDRPSGDELIAMKIHGVTPRFIQAIRSYTRGRVSIEQVIALRVHGAAPEFVRELEEIGYKSLSADELIAFRVHGVTAQFIKSIGSLGFNNVSAEELIAMRVHGVTPEFIQKVKGRGFSDVTIEQLIELKRLNIIPSSGGK
jgi:beta-lactamase regulating signal transducer with metallopeptidase domain